jgi:hypothetical protein
MTHSIQTKDLSACRSLHHERSSLNSKEQGQWISQMLKGMTDRWG